MPYLNRFIQSDNIFMHLSSNLTSIKGTPYEPAYAGFLSVSAVTVYELAIKDIFIEFAEKKNKHFGIYVKSHFDRINGKIKLKELYDNHIIKFGDKYVDKFKDFNSLKETSLMNSHKKSLKSAYNDLITCRHEFVHNGSPTLSIDEVIFNYDFCKDLIHCLAQAMKR